MLVLILMTLPKVKSFIGSCINRPALAVQARELTTQQSILQNQIEKLGDSLYRHGAMVIPGEATYDLNYYAVKLTSFTGTLTNFKDNTLTGGTSGVVVDVVNTVATDGTDVQILYLLNIETLVLIMFQINLQMENL